MSRYISPVNPAVYPHLAVTLLGIGLFFMGWFFVYPHLCYLVVNRGCISLHCDCMTCGCGVSLLSTLFYVVVVYACIFV